jgi:hypothetical protein
MRTFHEFLQEKETLDEGWGKNLLATGLMGLGALGASGCSGDSCPKPQEQPNANQKQSALKLIDGIVNGEYGNPQNGWILEVGNFNAWRTPEGVIYKSEDGNYYKRIPKKYGFALWKKFDINTGEWGRVTSITDYMRSRSNLGVQKNTPQPPSRENDSADPKRVPW